MTARPGAWWRDARAARALRYGGRRARSAVPRLALLALAALALPLAAAAQPVPRDVGDGTGGERALRRSSTGEPSTLDPQLWTFGQDGNLAQDLFQGLTTLDAAARPVPGQAQSWTISPDGRRYTFTLRPGLTWSDGVPIDSASFVWSLRRLFDPRTAAPVGIAALRDPQCPRSEHGCAAPRAARRRGAGPAHGGPRADAAGAVPARPAGASRLSRAAPCDREMGPRLDAGGPHRVERRVRARRMASRQPREAAAQPAIPRGVAGAARRDLPRARRGSRCGAASLPRGRARHRGLDPVGPARDGAPRIRVRSCTSCSRSGSSTSPSIRGADRPPIRGCGARCRWRWSASCCRRACCRRASLRRSASCRRASSTIRIQAARTSPRWPAARRGTEARRLLQAAGYGAAKPLVLRLRYSNSETQRRLALAIAAMWQPLGVRTELLTADLKAHQQALQQGDFDVARAAWYAEDRDPASFLRAARQPRRRAESVAAPATRSSTRCSTRRLHRLTRRRALRCCHGRNRWRCSRSRSHRCTTTWRAAWCRRGCAAGSTTRAACTSIATCRWRAAECGAAATQWAATSSIHSPAGPISTPARRPEYGASGRDGRRHRPGQRSRVEVVDHEADHRHAGRQVAVADAGAAIAAAGYSSSSIRKPVGEIHQRQRRVDFAAEAVGVLQHVDLAPPPAP